MSTCLNCGSTVEQKFCPNCGQRKDVQKITWPFIVKEIAHFFTHVEKNFLRSSGKMFYDPGAFVKSYLDGQRKDKQSPVSFLIIWASVFFLIRQVLIFIFNYKQELVDVRSLVGNEVARYYFIHGTYITIALIPVYAVVVWIVSGIYKKLNYAEMIIACFYAYGIFFMILALTTFIGGLVFKMNILSAMFINVYAVTTGLNAVWQWYSLMKQLNFRYALPRALIVLIAGSVIIIKFVEFVYWIIN